MTDESKSGLSDALSSGKEQGFAVRIMDQSGGGNDEALEGEAMEIVRGFMDLPHANAFARAYVRDSLERCRVPGSSAREVLESWFSFGENAEVIDSGEEGWKAATELDDFIANPATAMERDWRALDPRRLIDEDAFPAFEEDDEAEEEEERNGQSQSMRH